MAINMLSKYNILLDSISQKILRYKYSIEAISLYKWLQEINMHNYFSQHIGNDIYLLMVPYTCILILLTLLWDVYFVKMLMHYVRLYRECMKEANTDILGNASELALHYKTEIVKHVFMLVINANEPIVVLALELGFWKSSSPPDYKKLIIVQKEIFTILTILDSLQIQ